MAARSFSLFSCYERLAVPRSAEPLGFSNGMGSAHGQPLPTAGLRHSATCGPSVSSFHGDSRSFSVLRGVSSAECLSNCRPARRSPAKVQMSISNNGAGEVDSYLEAQVTDAVRMVPSCNRLYMSMLNGAQVEVVHVNPTAGRLLHQSSTPTIFLRIAGSSNLMLPIVVGEPAITALMKAKHQDVPGRPNQYELMGNLVELLDYEVRMVRVTDRVVDTYIARIYFAKHGTNELISVDARPSDAINLAVRCKVPIFVHRSIVLNDAVRVAHEPLYQPDGHIDRSAVAQKDPLVLDKALEEYDAMAEEMSLVKTMMIAVAEERYADAARIRDQLNNFRRMGTGQLNKH